MCESFVGKPGDTGFQHGVPARAEEKGQATRTWTLPYCLVAYVDLRPLMSPEMSVFLAAFFLGVCVPLTCNGLGYDRRPRPVPRCILLLAFDLQLSLSQT